MTVPDFGLAFSVAVDLLFYVPPIVCRGSVLVFVLVCIYVLSSFAIILTRKRELVALLLLSLGCLVTVNVLWLFLFGVLGWSAVCDCGIS